MTSNLKVLWDLLCHTDTIGRFKLCGYLGEIVLFRLARVRFRERFMFRVYDTNFVVRPNSGDMWIIWEIFEREVYTQFKDFQIRDGFTCLDIGANIGCVSMYWAKKNSGGRIIAVEPHPETCRRNRENLAANRIDNVEVLQVAIGARCGSIDLEVGPSSQAHVVGSEMGSVTDAAIVSVSVLTLDEIVATRGITHIDLLKIDVEGYEADALAGARSTLKMTDRVVLEYHSENLRLACRKFLAEAEFNLREYQGLLFAVKQG